MAAISMTAMESLLMMLCITCVCSRLDGAETEGRTRERRADITNMADQPAENANSQTVLHNWRLKRSTEIGNDLVGETVFPVEKAVTDIETHKHLDVIPVISGTSVHTNENAIEKRLTPGLSRDVDLPNDVIPDVVQTGGPPVTPPRSRANLLPAAVPSTSSGESYRFRRLRRLPTKSGEVMNFQSTDVIGRGGITRSNDIMGREEPPQRGADRGRAFQGRNQRRINSPQRRDPTRRREDPTRRREDPTRRREDPSRRRGDPTRTRGDTFQRRVSSAQSTPRRDEFSQTVDSRDWSPFPQRDTVPRVLGRSTGRGQLQHLSRGQDQRFNLPDLDTRGSWTQSQAGYASPPEVYSAPTHGNPTLEHQADLITGNYRGHDFHDPQRPTYRDDLINNNPRVTFRTDLGEPTYVNNQQGDRVYNNNHDDRAYLTNPDTYRTDQGRSSYVSDYRNNHDTYRTYQEESTYTNDQQNDRAYTANADTYRTDQGGSTYIHDQQNDRDYRSHFTPDVQQYYSSDNQNDRPYVPTPLVDSTHSRHEEAIIRHGVQEELEEYVITGHTDDLEGHRPDLQEALPPSVSEAVLQNSPGTKSTGHIFRGIFEGNLSIQLNSQSETANVRYRSHFVVGLDRNPDHPQNLMNFSLPMKTQIFKQKKS